MLLGDTEDIEIHVDSLVTGRHLVESVSLKGMPDRKNYALRLKISTFFSDEKTCHIIFEDMGFGEFFAPSGFRLEKIIELGGSNGHLFFVIRKRQNIPMKFRGSIQGSVHWKSCVIICATICT